MRTQAPAPPAPDLSDRITYEGKPLSSPQAIYAGLQRQQKELTNQIESLKRERSNAGTWLRQEKNLDAADRAGLQKRIVTVDGRIEALEMQRALVDAEVARAAGVPGAVVEWPRIVRRGPPDQVFVLGGIFMFVAILPISLAYARRIWRRGGADVAALPGDVNERLVQIDRAVESIALEVERIGEGQRFITRVLAEPSRVAANQETGLKIDASRRSNALE